MYAGLIGSAVHDAVRRGLSIAAVHARTNLLRTAQEGENYFGRLQSSGSVTATRFPRPGLCGLRSGRFNKWRSVSGSVSTWCTTGSIAASSRRAGLTPDPRIGLHSKKQTDRNCKTGCATHARFRRHPQCGWRNVHYEITVGIPSFLSPPFAFGIFTVRTGGGK